MANTSSELNTTLLKCLTRSEITIKLAYNWNLLKFNETNIKEFGRFQRSKNLQKLKMPMTFSKKTHKVEHFCIQ